MDMEVPMDKEEKWVSMEEICEHLGCSRDTVKKMIRTQNLPAYKIENGNLKLAK